MQLSFRFYSLAILLALGWTTLQPSAAMAIATASLDPIAGTELQSSAQLKLLLTEAPKATVIFFLSSRCPCSASHEPVIQELHKKYASRGFRFVAIHSNADEDTQNAREHFGKTAFSFPVISDPKSEIANRFGALKTPHAFVIGPKGEILFQGGVDDSADAAQAKTHFLRDAFEAIEAGKQPTPAVARALGCMIKRP